MRRVAVMAPAAARLRAPAFLAGALSATRHACPMGHHTPTATPVDAASPMCPVAGSVPNLRCPVETAEVVTPRSIATQLGKARLSAFVTATATAGYVLCGGTSPVAAVAVTLGTFLQSCSANGANQCLEVEHDAKMKRTCRRPLVLGQITRRGAASLSAAQLVTGSCMLAAVSPMAAALGGLNWFLYVCTYTPLKRLSTTNTWWGAIVGAIPPVMGGVAATGAASVAALGSAALQPAYLLGAVMFVWQIPHFMSLAFHCRRDYEAAGFKMLPFHHPVRSTVYSVALSVAMGAATVAGPALAGMPVEAWYYPVATAANATMVYKAWMFHVDPVRNCRGCFVFSYMYLAVMLVALVVNHYQPVGAMVSLAEWAMGTGATETAE